MNILKELKDRKVFRVGGAYLVAGWIIMQVLEVMVPALKLPESVNSIAAILLIAGFPIVVLLSWVFEITPDGVKLEDEPLPGERFSAGTQRKFNYIIIGGLIVGVALFVYDKSILNDGKIDTAEHEIADGSDTGASAEGTVVASNTSFSQSFAIGDIPEKSVAVIPFATRSAGTNDEYFADGLTEEIIIALSSVEDLSVTARGSAFYFKDQNVPVQEIANALGVAHIVDGSVRRDENRVRINAQLVRAADGFSLWSETYDHILEDEFEVQIDIATSVATALGVILDDDKRTQMSDVGIGDVEAFIAYQRGLEFYTSAHGDEALQPTLVLANAEFDTVVGINNNFAPAYLRQADLYTHILMDRVPFEGELFESETGITAEEALTQITTDLDAAYEAEKKPEQKLMIEANRIFLSPDWTDLGLVMDTALAQAGGCGSDLWISDVGPVFGRAAQVLEWNKSRMRCDRLDAAIHTFAAFSALMLGDYEETLQYLQDQEEMTGRDSDMALRLQALLAADRTDEANAVYAASTETGGLISVQMQAAQGNRAEAEAALAVMLAEGANDLAIWIELPAVAVTGDREEANRLAAAIDKTSLGATILSAATSLCVCGSPFDLDVTPNFRTRLEEGNLAWPPVSPIDWPLKDW